MGKPFDDICKCVLGSHFLNIKHLLEIEGLQKMLQYECVKSRNDKVNFRYAIPRICNLSHQNDSYEKWSTEKPQLFKKQNNYLTLSVVYFLRY